MQVADALWEHIKPAALRFRSTLARPPKAPPDLLARFKSYASHAAFKPFLLMLSAGTARQLALSNGAIYGKMARRYTADASAKSDNSDL